RRLEAWEDEEGDAGAAKELARHADRARAAFNERFWYAEGGYCYDVVDGEAGDDPACRPNQIVALSLRHPVLDVARWKPMLDVVTKSEEHTSELQSRFDLVCRLLLEKKKKKRNNKQRRLYKSKSSKHTTQI